MGKQTKTINNFSIKNNGKTYTDPIAVADIFNNFFSNIIKDSVISNITPLSDAKASNTLNPDISKNNVFRFTAVTENDVEIAINSLKNKQSRGFDDIPISVIKKAKSQILKPLTHCINSSLITGSFPEKLKIAKIIPIFKSGKTEEIASYRPISLLPSFSKIFEKVVYRQMIQYLEGNNLLDDQQHGFRTGRSTVTAGVNFVEKIIEAIDKQEYAIGVFLDMTKAFDSVLHERLFQVLYSFGIRGRELEWFKSYLTDRSQYVEINHINFKSNKKHCYKSGLSKVLYGVPQGSILGPLLFICYLTGLPFSNDGNATKIVLYADDANLIVTGKNCTQIELRTLTEMSKLEKFLGSSNLLLNNKKTKLISFHTRQNRNPLTLDIKLNNNPVEQLTETKFLGLIIDKNLSWDEHVKFITKKLSSGLYALRRMKHYCSLKTLKTIYYSLFQSHISYGICIYGATSKKNLETILVLQKKAIRIMLNLYYNDPVKACFKQLGILTVFDLYILETLKYCRQNRVNSQSQSHSYNTRKKFINDRHNLEFYKKKTTYAGTKFMQVIPQDIVIETSFNKFIAKLKSFLLGISCYSLEEFYECNRAGLLEF